MKKTGNRIAVPNVDREYTERPADRLLESCGRQIVLLNAGAGYGKTQLLANYVHCCVMPCAWYSLDETDNDFMSFLQYLIRAIQNALGSEAKNFLSADAGREGLDVLMEHLVVWLDEQLPAGGVIVVLDDFQEITNPDIFNLLTVLFETMEDKLRFFLIEKRSVHSFLKEYAARGRCACIGIDDLKLGIGEIGILLEKENILKTEERGQAAEMIFSCTEGWPVGIAQILLRLRSRRRNLSLDLVRKVCEELEVADYFLNRVYRMLPFDIQMFLKKTSVLDYMTAPACNQIMGIHNSDSLLRYLENEKLFVQSIGGNQGLYRCHSIFRRFLLSLLTPQEQRDCLRKAACYFMKTPDKIQAAEYGCRGKQNDIVQAVLEATGEELLREGLYETLERWFSFLKESDCKLSAKSRYIYGKYLWAMGKTAAAREQLGIAGRAFLNEEREKDYKGLMLFFAATERRSGNLRQAGACLAQLDHMQEKFLNRLALAECEERVRYACCLHRIPEAVHAMDEWQRRGGSFSENSFLFAANQILRVKKEGALSLLWSQGTEDRFLLRSCALAERMFHAYQEGSLEQIRKFAGEIIRDAPYETLQTAVAWKMLAVWSWESGSYSKAAEQAACGDGFLIKNQVVLSCFTRRHEQILDELSSLKKNQTGFRPWIEQKPEEAAADPEDVRIRIRCMNQFSVEVPGSEAGEIRWRTKKAKELFAYLFHLQGGGVSRDELMALLWPESGTKSATALFHTTLYSVRQMFVQAGMDDLILFEGRRYSLNMDRVSSDLEEVESSLRAYNEGREKAECVMERYAGGYMEGTGYLWSYAAAKQMENDCLLVCRQGADERMAAGEDAAAVPFLNRILEIDPYDEDAGTSLIRCLYRCGKRTEARQRYDRMVRLYREDLDLELEKPFREMVS